MSGRSSGAPGAACPICGKAPAGRYAPFCGTRCADLDLGRWLKGGYAIPGAAEEGQNPAPPPDPTLPQPPEED